jgi:hypothetical protein
MTRIGTGHGDSGGFAGAAEIGAGRGAGGTTGTGFGCAQPTTRVTTARARIAR